MGRGGVGGAAHASLGASAAATGGSAAPTGQRPLLMLYADNFRFAWGSSSQRMRLLVKNLFKVGMPVSE